jgi:hypothetical protein
MRRSMRLKQSQDIANTEIAYSLEWDGKDMDQRKIPG